MDYGELGHSVAFDYRMNIIADYNSPILAQKAYRERYLAPHRYAGAPLLCSSHSEDVITWNVFRTFQQAGRLETIAGPAGVKEPRALLIWGVAPQPDDDKGVLQFITGGFLREIDGGFPGEPAEPAIVLLGSTSVVVGVVARLSEQEDAAKLWGGRLNRVRNLRRRLKRFQAEHPVDPAKTSGILKDGLSDEAVVPVYQLVRLALLAKMLGAHYNVEPAVVSFASTRQWSEKETGTGRSAADWWEAFAAMLGDDAPRRDVVFWQHVPRLITDPSLVLLKTRLLRDPLLYDVAEERMPGW